MNLRLLLGLLLGAEIIFGLYALDRSRCFQLIGEAICRVETEEQIVALSFDDGPNPEGVHVLLPILEEHGVSATFFLEGRHVATHPDAARQLVEAGHELGNHGFSHRWLGRLSESTREREIAITDALLRKVGQADPDLLRPPFGEYGLGLQWSISQAGYRTVQWDVDDLLTVDDPEVYSSAIVERVRPGSIVLIHALTRDAEFVRQTVPQVIENLQAKGYRLVTVGQLLEHGE